jgi:hypothetical protein
MAEIMAGSVGQQATKVGNYYRRTLCLASMLEQFHTSTQGKSFTVGYRSFMPHRTLGCLKHCVMSISGIDLSP